MKTTKFMFLDNRPLEYVRGFTRELNRPAYYDGNPVMSPELPQEFNRVMLWGSVLRDPETGKFQLWYTSSTRDSGARSHLLYAESEDGYQWNKPELDVVPGTNIVMSNETRINGPTVILDEADPDAARRYKMIARWNKALFGYVSVDGIHWNRVSDKPFITANSDCHIGLYRNPESGLYHASFRADCPDRRVWRSESEDFLTWRRPVLSLEPDVRDPVQTQIYGMQMTPYGAYVFGWMMRYATWESDTRAGKPNGNWDIELAFSRGGYCWHRPLQGEYFIRRGDGGDWTTGLISVASSPLFFDHEIRFYFSACKHQHGDEYAAKRFQIGAASVRPDRFIGLRAARPDEPAELETRPFAVDPTEVYVNANASAGEIRVQLCDIERKPIRGFEFENCVPVTSDETTHKVRWSGNLDALAFARKPIRLLVRARNAVLYSVSFSDDASIGDYRSFKEIRCLSPMRDLEQQDER